MGYNTQLSLEKSWKYSWDTMVIVLNKKSGGLAVVFLYTSMPTTAMHSLKTECNSCFNRSLMINNNIGCWIQCARISNSKRKVWEPQLSRTLAFISIFNLWILKLEHSKVQHCACKNCAFQNGCLTLISTMPWTSPPPPMVNCCHVRFNWSSAVSCTQRRLHLQLLAPGKESGCPTFDTSFWYGTHPGFKV